MTSSARTVAHVLVHHGLLTLRALQHYTGLDWRTLYAATVELEEAGRLRCLAQKRPWRYKHVTTET